MVCFGFVNSGILAELSKPQDFYATLSTGNENISTKVECVLYSIHNEEQ